MKSLIIRLYFFLLTLFFVFATFTSVSGTTGYIPYIYEWGIYSIDLNNLNVNNIYSSPWRIRDLNLNGNGDVIVFSQRINSDEDSFEEICTVNVDGASYIRLTNDSILDTSCMVTKW